MSKGDISLAELYQALRDLQPDDEAATRIVHCLGLDQLARPVSQSMPGGFATTQGPEHRQRRAAEPEVKLGGREPPRPTGTMLPISVRSEETRSTTPEPPAWLRDLSVVALPDSRAARAPARAPEPLFANLRQRAILGAALATATVEGEIDIERAATRRARLEPLDRLPRRLVPTLRRGVQLLLDHAEGFTPFTADRERIVESIAEVAGASRVRVFRFRGCPLRQERGIEPAAWRPPPRGTVVAVVTDLGIGGPPLHRDRADRSEWLAFAAQVRRAGCPLVAFVPFPPVRWDRVLAHAMTIVHWDRDTTARALRRAIGRGHRVS